MASLRIALLVAMILTVATLASASRGFMRMSWEEREAFLKSSKPWHHNYAEAKKANPSFEHSYKSALDLPTSFDARKVWPGCVGAVLDQGDCNSCWAFAASEALSDRFCIDSKGKINVTLSPQDLLSCDNWLFGCGMGKAPNFAWDYLVDTGAVTMSCFFYTSGDGSWTSCETQCDDGEPWKKYKAASSEHLGSDIEPSKHVEDIMRGVMQGPIDVTFDVWGDFDDYQGGVYKRGSGAGYEGLHSVKIIGWGTDPKEGDYWIVQNSWGTTWGPYGGYFLIARGVDECFIEALAYTGTPSLN